MYNTELYEILLAKKHHAYRKPFDKINESAFTDPTIPSEKRMAKAKTSSEFLAKKWMPT